MTEREITLANRMAEREAANDEPQKKKKKKARRRFMERWAEVTNMPPPANTAEEAPIEEPVVKPNRVRTWLRPARRQLRDSERINAQQSSALIAINCFLVAAFAFVGRDGGWAWIPMVLTALSSLACAVMAAQPAVPLTAEPLPESVPDKAHVYAALERDLRAQTLDFERRAKLLRMAYTLLLAGVPLSMTIFGATLLTRS